MPFDYDALEASRNAKAGDLGREPARYRPPDDEPEPTGLLSDVVDTLVAVPRGIVGAAQGVLSLADTLTGDAIPDFLHDSNPFGPSKNVVSGLVEGLTQFSAGFFLPGVGGAALASKLGAAGAITKGLVGGAITDFTVFSGHEDRLSNVIQKVPALSNVVTDFLESEEDDPELLGRLKATLEGAVLGVATDAVTRALGFGLRRVKAARALREELPDAAPEVIARKVDEAVPVTPETQAAVDELLVPADDPLRSLDAQPPLPPRQAAALLAGEPPAEAAPGGLIGGEAGAADLLRRFNERAGRRNKVNPRNLSARELVEEDLRRSDLNLDHFTGAEGAFQLVRAIEGFARAADLVAPGGIPRSLAQQLEEGRAAISEIVSGSENVDKAMARLAAEARLVAKQEVDLTGRISAIRTMTQMYRDSLGRKAELISLGKATDDEYATFVTQASTLVDVELSLKGVGSERGRGLRALGAPVPFLDRLELEQIIKGAGGRGEIKRLADGLLKLKGESPHKVISILEESLGRKVLGATQEFWTASILSGVKTPLVDLVSSTMFAVWRPLETLAGAAVRSLLPGTGAGRQARLAAQQIGNLTHGFSAMMTELRLGHKANVLRGEVGAQLDGLASKSGEIRSYLDPATLSIDRNSPGGRTMAGLSRFAQTVFGAMRVNENATKHLVLQSYGRSILTDEALEKGLRGEAARQYVEDGMLKIVRNGQLLSKDAVYREGLEKFRLRGSDEISARAKAARWATRQMARPEMAEMSAVAEKVRSRAREVSFTTRASDNDSIFGDVSRLAEQARQKIPFLRFVLPFVNTPLNIAQAGLQRLDVLGPARLAAAKVLDGTRFGTASLERSRNRFIRDMISGDPERAADALGRFTFATGAMATFGSLAASGSLTGRGPEDPRLAKQLKQAGWQPYSIKVGDAYVSYARLEPVASVLGMIADAMTVSKWTPSEDGGALDVATKGIAVALANQTTNKTFLQGIYEFTELLHSPVKQVERAAGRLANGFFPAAIKQFTPLVDPDLREARGFVDQALRGVPGIGMPPVRNLLGEEVPNGDVFQDAAAFLGQRYSVVSDDVIAKEIAGLGHAFAPPSPFKLDLDLREVSLDRGRRNAYDRFQALQGRVKLGGKTLRRALSDLIGSRQYQALPILATEMEESPRVLALQRVVSSYRRAAWYELLDEVPELEQRRRQGQLDRRLLQAGRPGTLNVDPQGFLIR